MIKKMITTAALIFSAISLQAASTHVSVELKSGYKYDFMMNGKPQFSITDGELLVRGTDVTSFCVSDIKNFHYTINKELSNVSSNENGMCIQSLDEKTIRVANAPVSTKIVVTDADGHFFATAMTDGVGNCTLNLPNESGVYVLSINGQTIKFILN